jgi:hypothetical protein
MIPLISFYLVSNWITPGPKDHTTTLDSPHDIFLTYLKMQKKLKWLYWVDISSLSSSSSHFLSNSSSLQGLPLLITLVYQKTYNL